MKLFSLIILFLFISGCAFTKVDFKYSNLAHMNYRDAMTTISIKPEKFAFDFSEAFRLHGATILDRKKINYIFTEVVDAQKCWEARYEIYQKEFNSYRANDFSIYQNIDREQPYINRQINSNCQIFKETISPEADSWLLIVEFPPRSAKTILYQPNVDSFFIFGNNAMVQGLSTSSIPKQVDISISTRLYAWIWKLPNEQKTSVYLEARPVSGQIESRPGNSIGYSWWQVANGYSEQQTVRHYISLIQEYDRKISYK